MRSCCSIVDAKSSQPTFLAKCLYCTIQSSTRCGIFKCFSNRFDLHGRLSVYHSHQALVGTGLLTSCAQARTVGLVSAGWLVGWLVGWSVGCSVCFPTNALPVLLVLLVLLGLLGLLGLLVLVLLARLTWLEWMLESASLRGCCALRSARTFAVQPYLVCHGLCRTICRG